MCAGRYVAVLHDDDRWAPRFLAVLVPALERHPEAVMAFCDHHLIDDAGRIDSAATDSASQRFGRADLSEGLIADFLGLVIRQSVKITGCVWRREALPVSELVPGVAPHLDVWLSYLLAREGAPAYYSPERLMSYRLHPGAHSASRDPAVWLAGIQCEGRDVARSEVPRARRRADQAGRRLSPPRRRGDAPSGSARAGSNAPCGGDAPLVYAPGGGRLDGLLGRADIAAGAALSARQSSRPATESRSAARRTVS